MKIHFLILILILFLATPAFSQEPRIEIYTNKESYHAGERGIIIAEIETLGEMSEAEIEIEILSPEGKLVYGDLVYTRIPQRTVLNPYTEQTEQIIYHEDIEYLSPGKVVRRYVDFEIPIDVISGTYTVNVRLASAETFIEKSKSLYISGSGKYIEFVIVIYIVILIFSLYLLWR